MNEKEPLGGPSPTAVESAGSSASGQLSHAERVLTAEDIAAIERRTAKICKILGIPDQQAGSVSDPSHAKPAPAPHRSAAQDNTSSS